jgi:glycine hydroxymethyltransferase
MIVAGASAYSLHIDFAALPRDRRQGRRLLLVDMAHYAGLVAAGLYPSPVGIADFVTDHAQDAARPARRLILGKAEAREADQLGDLPRHPGRSADARHRRQGGRLQGSADARVQGLPAAGARQRKGDGRTVLTERGVRIVSGRTESHVFLLDLRAKNITGKEAEAALGRAHITVNKNAIPNDPRSPS